MKMTEITKPAPSRAAVLAQLLSWFEKNIASGAPIVPIEFGEINGVPVDSVMAAGALRGHATMLSACEQTAVLRDPNGLLVLMNYHEEQESRSESMGDPGDGKGNRARREELKAMGRKIVEADTELWPDEILREFGFSDLVVSRLAALPAVEPNLERQRDLLAKAIRDAAVKSGICGADADLTGPHLLILADDLGNAALLGNTSSAECGSAPKVVVYIDDSAVTHVYSSLPGMKIVVHDSVALERDGFNQVRRKDILDKVTVECQPAAFVDSFNALKGLA